MPRIAALSIAGILGLTSLACLGPDLTPPPPPSVDPVRSPTSVDSPLVSGTAEYDSLVVITRSPELPDGRIETRADAFTAQWSARVPLEPTQENVLRIVAIDAAGNQSDPTEVVIVHQPPVAHSLALTITPAVLEPNVHAFEATAELLHPEPEADLEGQTVFFERRFTPSEETTEHIIEKSATVDGARRASVIFDGHFLSGHGSVRAWAQAGGAQAERSFEVHGQTETLNSLVLLLEAVVDGTHLEPSSSISVPAGTSVRARGYVEDAYGETVEQPVALATTAPEAIIDGQELEGLIVAGLWDVIATIPGTPLVATADLEIVPGSPDAVDLRLGLPFVRIGEPLPYSVGVLDAWGNLIDSSAQVTTQPPSSTVDETAREIRFHEAQEYEVIARVGDGQAEDRQTVQVLDTHGQPPRVDIRLPLQGSFVGIEERSVQLRVRATDQEGLVAVLLRAEGPNIDLETGTYLEDAPEETEVLLSMNLPAGSDGDDVSFTPVAVSTQGVAGTGNPLLLARRSGNPRVSPGYILRVVAGGDNPLPSEAPRGVTIGADGRAVVVGRPNWIVAVDLETGEQEDLGVELPDSPYDVVTLPAERGDGMIVSYTSGVARLDRDGTILNSTWLESGQNPRGMDIGEDGRLYVVNQSDDRIYAYDIHDAMETRRWTEGDRQSRVSCDGEIRDRNPWGVAYAGTESTSDQRVLYAGRWYGSGSYNRVMRCTDDGFGGNQSESERAIAGGLLNQPIYMAIVGSRDLLTTSWDNDRLLRAFHDGGSWQHHSAVEGLNRPFGIRRVENGRYVFTTQGDRTLYELVLELPAP